MTFLTQCTATKPSKHTEAAAHSSFGIPSTSRQMPAKLLSEGPMHFSLYLCFVQGHFSSHQGLPKLTLQESAKLALIPCHVLHFLNCKWNHMATAGQDKMTRAQIWYRQLWNYTARCKETRELRQRFLSHRHSPPSGDLQKSSREVNIWQIQVVPQHSSAGIKPALKCHKESFEMFSLQSISLQRCKSGYRHNKWCPLWCHSPEALCRCQRSIGL